VSLRTRSRFFVLKSLDIVASEQCTDPMIRSTVLNDHILLVLEAERCRCNRESDLDSPPRGNDSEDPHLVSIQASIVAGCS
jgi:hypothetical protein